MISAKKLQNRALARHVSTFETATFWVDRDKLLATVVADTVRDALRGRYERVLECLEEE